MKLYRRGFCWVLKIAHLLRNLGKKNKENTSSWEGFLTKTEFLMLSKGWIENYQRIHIEFIWMFPKNRGTPKWMVYDGKPYFLDDLGVPLFSETPI